MFDGLFRRGGAAAGAGEAGARTPGKRTLVESVYGRGGGAPSQQPEAAEPGSNVSSQAATDDDMDTPFLDATPGASAERVCFGQDKVNRTGYSAPIHVGAGETIAFLARSFSGTAYTGFRDVAEQPARITVFRDQPGGAVAAQVSVAAADLPRRYEVKDLAPGRYVIAIEGQIDPEAPPAWTQVEAWAVKAGAMLDDKGLEAAARVERRVDVSALVGQATAERVTLGKEHNFGVSIPVPIVSGQDLFAAVRFPDTHAPIVSQYHWQRERAPEKTNTTCVVRLVDPGTGRAVAHVVVDPLRDFPLKITVSQPRPGTYALAMTGLLDRTKHAVPMQGFAGAIPGGESAAPPPPPATPTIAPHR